MHLLMKRHGLALGLFLVFIFSFSLTVIAERYLSRGGQVNASSLAKATDSIWRQISTTQAPKARYTHGMTYDSARHKMVLFGGDGTGSERLSDTWEYDGNIWQQINTYPLPPGRANIDQTLVFDSLRNRVVLFGGLSSQGYMNDTWEFDGSSWSRAVVGQSPPARDSHAMVYDSYRNVTVLYGGFGLESGYYKDDTWEYDGTSWHQVLPAQSPSKRYHHAMAFDSDRNVTVLFGGRNASGLLSDTWEYDGIEWRQINTPQSPSSRENHSLAYDTARGITVMFGGYAQGEVPLNETWEYNGTTWQQVDISHSPSPRVEPSLAYDPVRNRIVFFGGGYWKNQRLTVFDETWEYETASLPTPPTPVPTPATPIPTPTPPLNQPAVVLVHGWNGFPSSLFCHPVEPETYFQGVDTLLQNSGYHVEFARLDTSSCGTPPILDNVGKLKEAIDAAKHKTGQTKVILIAHSMGGLVSRAYVEGNFYEYDVSEIFTFGSPHRGVPLDVFPYLFHVASLGHLCTNHAGVCDMTTLSMILFNRKYKQRSGVTYHLVTGDAPFFSRNPFGAALDILVVGEDDGIVPVYSGIGQEGMMDRRITDEVHSPIFGSRSYFVRDGSASISYIQCIKKVLIEQGGPCGNISAASSTGTSGTIPASRSPFYSGSLSPGQTVTHSVFIEGGTAVFAAHWQGGPLILSLKNPEGLVIEPSLATSRWDQISYQEDEFSTSYYISDTVAGPWQMTLEASEAAAVITYTAFAAYTHGTRVSVETDDIWYAPGTTAAVTVSLQPPPTSAVVTATAFRPDGVIDIIGIKQDSIGTFVSTYTIPSSSGYLELRINADGTTTDGLRFQNETFGMVQIASTRFTLLEAFHDTPVGFTPHYELLAVWVPITASSPGRVGVSADLQDSNGNLVAHANVVQDIDSNHQDVALQFAGNDIYRSQLDGPYVVTNVLLTDEQDMTLIATTREYVYWTAHYDYQEFRPLSTTIYLPTIFR